MTIDRACRRRRLGGVAASWLAMLAGGVSAPASAADEEDLYFSTLPVVASVSRLPQPLSEAPGSVTVIDRDTIRASGARNFADLLRLVPGFQVTPPNQEGAVVAYHGLSNSLSGDLSKGVGNSEYTPRVQVLVDGRSLYSPLFLSGVNWNLLPVALDDIERIEVSRGSNSAAYGSSAFLGVINIITLDASQAKGWLAAVNHGNQNIRDETLRWGGKVGSADVRLTAQQIGDGGFRKMFDGNLGWFDPHDSRHAKLFDLRADISLTERDELRLSMGQASDISQFGRPRSTSDPFRDLSQSSTYLSAEWRRALAGGGEMKLRFSHVDDWASGRFVERVSFNDINNTPIVPFNFRSDTGGKSSSNEVELQHIFSPWQRTRLVWGATLKDVALTSQYQFHTMEWKHRSNARLFGNLEWRPEPKWLFNLGSSIEHDSLSGEIFDPRVSVSYHLTPENTVRLVASRAHRAPSMYEALGDSRKTPPGANSPVDRVYLAAPGLKPERIDTVEAGYLGEFKSLGASVDVRWFHESIPNRITIVPYALPGSAAEDRDQLLGRMNPLNGSVFPFGRADAALNLERVSIQGYEYQWRWQPFEATRIMFGHAYIRIFANLTDESMIADIRSGVLGDNTTKISQQTRDSAPRHSTTAMLMQRLPYNLEASVMYYKSASMSWRRNPPNQPYERVDWRLAKSFPLGASRAEIAYTAQLANHPQDGRMSSRQATETHWVSLRVEY